VTNDQGMTERILDWDGCYNVRDLGGLPIASGGVTRSGAIIRSAAAFQLTEAGWAAAHAYGVRTVVDLMDPNEFTADASPRPSDIVTVNVPLDDMTDHEFWDPLVANGHWGTALYYPAFLDRFPDRVRAAVTAIADAGPGGVLVHCGRGQDRTGLISMVLLALVGVAADAIVEDYELCMSPDTIGNRVALGERDDGDRVRQILQLAGTTNRDAILDALAAVDVVSYDARESIRRRLS
jgi:protein-tyrosine phosphatase